MSKTMKVTMLVAVSLMLTYGVMLFSGCSSSSDSTPAATATPLPDAIKSTIFINDILADDKYTYLHGSTSPDGTKMMVVVNKADAAQGVTTGEMVLYLLDAVELTQGKVVKLLGPASLGSTASTPSNVSFRSNWTADGTKIMLAGGSNFWVVNAADLTSLNGADGDDALLAGSSGTYFHNHDALATTDAKYALLALRTKPSGTMDGEIKLYDLTTNSVVGAGVSVCNGCHITDLGVEKTATLCGIDGKVELQANGTYSGTVYVAGHGGHFAQVPVTIDPSNTTTPVTIGSMTKLTVSSLKFPTGTSTAADNTSQYKLHDVRLDGTTLYWSTYNTDINSVAHYGTYNLTTKAVVDNTEAIPATVTSPAIGVNKMPIYCASGITAKAHMPMTMTSPAYISVFPR